ncbi:putative RDD family membrane protein YckC [Nocardioides cavernae]|uniref:Putative RDD family membrane protein YckC n=1 Tax=Nocardioides cavernae TaxID=1921566 RepID=A0A7Y9KS06_9ACTN|nr:RDD family protein [Nocardioides cavernae]NYE37120.1 putative RDD family membrane protein YckC [Nocardioides cavernae]
MTQHPQHAGQHAGQHALTYPVAQLERRFTAFAVDRLLAWSLLAVVGVVTAMVVSDDLWTVVGAVAGAMVLVWLVNAVATGVSGTSVGKAMTGLRVVHHGTGTPIGVGPALLRSLVLGIAGLPTFGIGVATLAWTAVEDRGRQRRGWHDHLTHTVVVDVRPAVEVTEAADEGPRHIVNLTAMRLVPAPPVEDVRTPERTEQSVRRQPLLPEVAPPTSPPPSPQQPPAPQPQVPQPGPSPQWGAPPQQSAPQPRQPAPESIPQSGPPVGWQPQQPQQPQQQPAASRPPAAPARWRVRFDNGESFVIAGLALVGRRPEARSGEQVAHLIPLSSADMSVSKTHAQFGPASDGTIVVMDRGSTNGTVLVRQGVSRQLAPGKPAALIDGDKVVYGDREMTISREA